MLINDDGDYEDSCPEDVDGDIGNDVNGDD